jgi:glycosyltransferase involved in cell wall biosynthesis
MRSRSLRSTRLSTQPKMAEAQHRIRLVHVTTVPETLGFLAGQAGCMRSRSFDTHAISSPGELLWRFAEREGVEVSAVDMPRRITPIRDLGAIVRIYWRLRRLGARIVHAHTPKGGLLGMIGAWLARTPIRIYHIHGLPFMTATGYRRSLLWWTERVSCALAHQVLCVSHSVREVAIQSDTCPAGKIEVLLGGSANGVDGTGRFDPAQVGERARQEIRSRYEIPADALVVGYVGRIVRDKGMVELTEAWKVLREELPWLHFLVVGPFEPTDPVPAAVEALLKGDPRIHLTGWVDDTPPLFAAMDLLVLPSYREGLPYAPLEAASMGLPVVATRIPGCVDAVEDGITGTLIPSRDVEALIEAIRMYVTDPALRREHGQAGRERVLRDFNQQEIWAALYREYSRLLHEKSLALPGVASASA